MPYSSKPLVKSGDGSIAPQYFNPTADQFESVEGKNGAINMNVTSANSLLGAIQNVTTAGNRVQLPNIPCREVTVIAKRGNTGYIYLGGSDVSSTVYGVELAAKESYTFMVSNANLIYVNANVSGEGVSYIVL
ncbi:hypothetical protein D3C71_1182930 [compost metagenome]